jgi:hypothetical protein
MNTYNIKIKGNINQEEIDNFIEFYKNCAIHNGTVVYESTGEEINKIEIEIESDYLNHDIYLEVDPIFLGYLVLFLDTFQSINVEFKIVNPFIEKLKLSFSEDLYKECVKISDRAFSLFDQIEFLKEIPEFKNRIKLIAEYYNKDKNESFNLAKKNESSKRFFPVILIRSNEDIDKYFSSHSNIVSIVFDLYRNKVIDLTKSILEVDIQSLSPIQVYILRMLLTDDNPENNKLTKGKLEYYIHYCNQLCFALKELAINFVEHSRIDEISKYSAGVITGRLFDKKRLLDLKSDLEFDYLRKFDENEFFLDINVIDLGYLSLRKKYISNIENNVHATELNSLDCLEDINVINDRNNFTFQDFYLPNSKTQHQTNKLISRYGIQYFTHLCTSRFDGFIKAISHDEGVIIEGKMQDTKLVSKERFGTSYNCLIPLNKFNIFHKTIQNKKSKLIGLSTDLYAELNKFSFPKQTPINYKFSEYELIEFDEFPTSWNPDEKYNYISIFSNTFRRKLLNFSGNVILIDAAKSKVKTPSDWIRLLSNLGLDFKNIIVFNIDKEVTREIVDIRRTISSNVDLFNFWNTDSSVLFYSYQNKFNSDFYRYGATILSGNSEAEYNYLNRCIWKSHYSYYKGFILSDSDVEPELFANNKFFINGNLLSFDLLIDFIDKNGSPISLFEKSLQYALNKSLDENLRRDTNNKGYKIENTHFRLGSKIHIDKFFYAKRVFQNSFFATPLAFLIAKSIQSVILNDSNKTIEKKNFTVFGYESYSESLVSVIRKLLGDFFGNEYYFNHNTISTDCTVSRSIETIQENIFIIVPIASTFSTSIKIKKDISDILL